MFYGRYPVASLTCLSCCEPEKYSRKFPTNFSGMFP